MYEMDFAEPTLTTWALLRQSWIAVNKVAEAKLAKKGLTPEKAAVLWACRDYPDPLTPAEIARLVSREAQTVAGLLNRMEKEGLVRRIPKRKGRPFTEIKMTAKGKELCDVGVEIYKSLIQDLSADMPEGSRDEFHKNLRDLRNKMLDKVHIEIEEQPLNLPLGKKVEITW